MFLIHVIIQINEQFFMRQIYMYDIFQSTHTKSPERVSVTAETLFQI